MVPAGADQADSVIGTYSRTGLSSGQLLDTSMLQTEAPFDTGDVRVGVPLTAGRVPADLRSGDQVRISWTDTAGESHTATVTLVEGPVA